MAAFAKCDIVTGALEGFIVLPSEALRHQVRAPHVTFVPVDEDIAKLRNAGEDYYCNCFRGVRSVIPRPELPAVLSSSVIVADGVSAARITRVPKGSRISVDGQDQGETDGQPISITSPMPASYEIVIEHWPHRTWRRTITAE